MNDQRGSSTPTEDLIFRGGRTIPELFLRGDAQMGTVNNWVKPDFTEVSVNGECTAYAGAIGPAPGLERSRSPELDAAAGLLTRPSKEAVSLFALSDAQVAVQ